MSNAGRTYANQFPRDWHPDAGTLAVIRQAGLIDLSWGNEACPRWVRPCGLADDVESPMSLWVDAADPDHREDSEAPRYVVATGHGPAAYAGEDLGLALAALATAPPDVAMGGEGTGREYGRACGERGER